MGSVFDPSMEGRWFDRWSNQKLKLTPVGALVKVHYLRADQDWLVHHYDMTGLVMFIFGLVLWYAAI